MSSNLPLVGVALGRLAGMLFALRFNLRTFALVKNIQDAYAVEGRVWPFWTDSSRRLKFVLRPNDLLDSGDSPRIRVAKEQLLRHRKTAGSNLLLGMGSMLLGVALALLIAALLTMTSS